MIPSQFLAALCGGDLSCPSGESHKSEYAYDRDNRVTEIVFDGGSQKVNYTYDELGRAATRVAECGAEAGKLTSTYEYVDGGYGTNSTTPLVKKIIQNGISFEYAYDSCGNIINEKRGDLTTTYQYDALGQLVRVNNPHENATWIYTYDRGGNILSKKRYAFTIGTLGTILETIPYTYGDSNWKDKLTSYNGKTITYDAIGNPLNDGERTYTWGAGRQLRHISMLTGEEHGFRASNGVHEDSSTRLRIVHDEVNSKLKAKLLRDGRDITDECVASAFVWTRNGSPAGTGKEIAITDAEVNGDVQFSCTYTETQGVYGTVSVDSSLAASHTPATADANHVFSLENGILKVEIPNNTGNGTDYELVDGVLSVNPGFTGSITAEYEFITSPTREIDFAYDHNGLRTQKIVVENGVTTTYDYTLHGKRITHLTKKVVNLDGVETSEELHFFYDAQSRPAKVSFGGVLYTYIHNLQGDIVGLLDNDGTLMVEYKYDDWGKVLSTTGIMADALGYSNPFRYRGYIYDEETWMYWVRSRYYYPELHRFINADVVLGQISGLKTHNAYEYCYSDPICNSDPNGNTAVDAYIFYQNAAAADGPSLLGDIIGVLGALYIYFQGIASSQSTVNTSTATEVRSEPTVSPSPSPTPAPTVRPTNAPTSTPEQHQEYFPQNPLQFKPFGLIINGYPPHAVVPTVIKWSIPGTKISLFEWNYDAIYGSYYHVMLPSMNNEHLEGGHYKPGDMVPEPWNSLFFGGASGEPWLYLE